MAVAVVAAVAAQPVQAQDKGSKADKAEAKADKAEAAAAKKGVRLVVCSASGESLPHTLYVQQGKKFAAVSLGARTLSKPIAQVGGEIKFWKEDPTSALAGKLKDKDAEADIAELLPPADYTLSGVPSSSKMVGIVIPAKEGGKLQGLFFKESDFPQSGVHLINLSPYPVQMTTSEKGDYSDSKVKALSPFRKDDGICDKNSFSVKGEDGQQVAFAIAYKAQGMKTFKRFKMSTLAVSSRQSQVTVLLKDPTRDQPKMLSFQMMDAK